MSGAGYSAALGGSYTDRPPILVSERHSDPYEARLGRGIPVYIAVEEDAGFPSPKGYSSDGAATAEVTGFPASANKDEYSREGDNNQLLQYREMDKQSPFRTAGGYPSSNELWRFRRRGCQDAWMAFLFLMLLVVVLLWGVSELQNFELTDDMTVRISQKRRRLEEFLRGEGNYQSIVGFSPLFWPESGQDKTASVEPNREPSASNGKNLAENASMTIQDLWSRVAALQWGAMAVLFTGLSLVVAVLDIQLIRLMPRALILMFSWLNTILFAITSLMFYSNGYFMVSLLFALIAVLPLLWLFLVRSRIDFSVCLVVAATRVIQQYYGLVILSLCVALLSVAYSLFMLCLLFPPSLRQMAGESLPRDTWYTVLVILSFFWGTQVLIYATHVVCSGVVATWYFSGCAKMPASPIFQMLRRAFFDNFGSICFGSLLVALMDFIYYLFNAASSESDDYSFVSCILLCMLNFIDFLLGYFNEYAFVHVGIYGCSYLDAAKVTWQLTRQCLFAAVFNDCLVSQTVWMAALFTDLAMSAIAYALTRDLTFCVVVCIISDMVNNSVFQIFRSTVITIFVCFAELPEALEVSFPELYKSLMKYDAGMIQNFYSHTGQPKYGTL